MCSGLLVTAGYLQLFLPGLFVLVFFLFLTLCPSPSSFPFFRFEFPVKGTDHPLLEGSKMFVYHPKDLPADPVYLADMKELGYDPSLL